MTAYPSVTLVGTDPGASAALFAVIDGALALTRWRHCIESAWGYSYCTADCPACNAAGAVLDD